MDLFNASKVSKHILFLLPSSFSFKNTIKRDVAFSLFLTVFLVVFRPFGLDVYRLDRIYVFLGYGLVTLTTTVFNDFLIHAFFSDFFIKNKLRVYHRILLYLWHFLCLGATNFLFAIYLDAFPLNMLSFFKIQLYVILCASVPLTMYLLLKQNYLTEGNFSEANKIAIELDSKINNSSKNFDLNETPILFYSENLKESLTVLPSNILYLISQDNYVEFFWRDEMGVHKKLLRNSLQFYETQLAEDSHFFRCHRSYIVNLNKVESVSGNSQGYLLSVKGLEDKIPVARSKGKDLKNALHRENLDFYHLMKK